MSEKIVTLNEEVIKGQFANSEKTERLFRTSGALSTFETVQA